MMLEIKRETNELSSSRFYLMRRKGDKKQGQ
jgi:hypothetical protein